MQRDAGGGGRQDFVIPPSGLRVGARKQVGLDLDAVADQVLVDFNFVGIAHGIDHDQVADRGFNRDRAVGVVDGDTGLGPDIETIFLVAFGDQRPGQHGGDGDKLDGANVHSANVDLASVRRVNAGSA